MQATLSELTDQRLTVQQAHWNVTGPLFYSLHNLLGELYQELNEAIDPIAGRKLAWDRSPDARSATVAQTADLTAFFEGFVTDKQVLDLLTERYKTMSDRTYECIDTTGETDPVTQDMLIDVARLLDDHLGKRRALQK